MTKLKEVRLAKGLTQFELAKRCDINPADISKIETGVIGRPYAKWRKAIAAALEVKENELFPEVCEKCAK